MQYNTYTSTDISHSITIYVYKHAISYIHIQPNLYLIHKQRYTYLNSIYNDKAYIYVSNLIKASMCSRQLVLAHIRLMHAELARPV